MKNSDNFEENREGKLSLPFGPLRFLYIGSKDVERDSQYYKKSLGGEILWRITDFGTTVAAIKISDGPVLLLADHQPAPSCEPVYEVADLKETVKELRKRGWKLEVSTFEIPSGPCFVFKDPSGNSFAVFQDVRPNVMDYFMQKYKDSLQRSC